jgi:hypothetical protein
MASSDLFLSMSEELCGIPIYYLRGTGFADTYWDTVLEIIGNDLMDRLLASYASLPTCCQQDRKAAIRADLLSDDEFGPVARNIIKLWFAAVWFELPQEWHQKYKVFADDRTFIPKDKDKGYAYPESLLGPAIGAHPAGAKPTGHQAWVSPPDYLPFAEARFPSECENAK